MDQYAFMQHRMRLTPRAYAWRWVVSLALLLLMALIDQALVQKHLLAQQADAALLNLAGRQRMLCLTLQHQALALLAGQGQPGTTLGALGQAQRDWDAGHFIVSRSDGRRFVAAPSQEAQALLSRLEPLRQAVGQAVDSLFPLALALALVKGPALQAQVEALMAAGDHFLPLMDRLASVLGDEATSRVQRLRHLELLLVGGFLLMLLAMGLFLFIPLGRRLRQDLDLLAAASQEMYDLSLQDGVTEVANRRHLDKRLASEWRRAGRQGQPLGLIIPDIDYFKNYSNAPGHQAGDLALVKVAGARQAARYGGEEFALLLPNTPLDGALSLAEQLRQQVRSLTLNHPDSAVAGVVTVSLGAACLAPVQNQPLNAERPEQLLEAANRSLYKAKQSGRDRVGPTVELR